MLAVEAAVEMVLVELEGLEAVALEDLALVEDHGLLEPLELPILAAAAAVNLDLTHQPHILQALEVLVS
jgi:hypothetical protein